MIDSSGFPYNIEYERLLSIIEQQNELITVMIVFLGAIFGATIFRHLRK